MVSTSEIVLLILLFIGLIIAIWWFIVAEKFNKYMSDSSYTRGANASKSGDVLNLSCGAGNKICVYRATQTCTKPGVMNGIANVETSQFEAISDGINSNASYGAFNPQTTVDRTAAMGSACNGKDTCSVKFTPSTLPGGATCDGTDQLISTYTCIPQGEQCTSASPGLDVRIDEATGNPFPSQDGCPQGTYNAGGYPPCGAMMCPGGIADGGGLYNLQSANEWCDRTYAGTKCQPSTGNCV